MNKLNMLFNSTGKLNINIQDLESGIRLIFEGLVDDKNPETLLSNFFEELHEKLIKFQCKEVEVDLKN